MPAAAYRASMPPPICSPGGIIGVSGGGGEPRWAFVVDVEAVELNLFTPPGFGTRKPLDGPTPGASSPGGGQYC